MRDEALAARVVTVGSPRPLVECLDDGDEAHARNCDDRLPPQPRRIHPRIPTLRQLAVHQVAKSGHCDVTLVVDCVIPPSCERAQLSRRQSRLRAAKQRLLPRLLVEVPALRVRRCEVLKCALVPSSGSAHESQALKPRERESGKGVRQLGASGRAPRRTRSGCSAPCASHAPLAKLSREWRQRDVASQRVRRRRRPMRGSRVSRRA